jgi:hypothetical protein
MNAEQFSAIVQQGVELQRQFPGKELVGVGGTAASLHCGHRFSVDVDCVTPHLRAEFDAFAQTLANWPGWRTNRTNAPVLILGERAGVELGVRQLRRAEPLRVTVVQGLVIPTVDETLRVKAFLLGERRATRDYLDFAALAHRVGESSAIEALGYLNLLYPTSGSQTAVTRFAEACEALPVDFAAVELSNYKGLTAPFTDWEFVSDQCQACGRLLLRRELQGKLAHDLDGGFR